MGQCSWCCTPTPSPSSDAGDVFMDGLPSAAGAATDVAAADHHHLVAVHVWDYDSDGLIYVRDVDKADGRSDISEGIYACMTLLRLTEQVAKLNSLDTLVAKVQSQRKAMETKHSEDEEKPSSSEHDQDTKGDTEEDGSTPKRVTPLDLKDDLPLLEQLPDVLQRDEFRKAAETMSVFARIDSHSHTFELDDQTNVNSDIVKKVLGAHSLPPGVQQSAGKFSHSVINSVVQLAVSHGDEVNHVGKAIIMIEKVATAWLMKIKFVSADVRTIKGLHEQGHCFPLAKDRERTQVQVHEDVYWITDESSSTLAEAIAAIKRSNLRSLRALTLRREEREANNKNAV